MGQINAPVGSNRRKSIVGRGSSSKGRTCGRGNNGQNSRSGGGVRPGFEGGQMPLYRRVARRGFSNYPFKEEYEVVSLDAISAHFEDNDIVNTETLKGKNLLKGHNVSAKILANGELTKKVVFEGLKMSAAAAEKITSAGGEIKE
ncbi:MAG: 50S ribosomal protein L15 [Sphaerochaetaceae bacterium]|nr:50S ribosomal protein L15 [Sphaerochaetaceae bacterium]